MNDEFLEKNMDRALRRKLKLKFKIRKKALADTLPYYKTDCKPEKLFRNLTGRHNKVKRCEQLKIVYPRVSSQTRCKLAQTEFWC